MKCGYLLDGKGPGSLCFACLIAEGAQRKRCLSLLASGYRARPFATEKKLQGKDVPRSDGSKNSEADRSSKSKKMPKSKKAKKAALRVRMAPDGSQGIPKSAKGLGKKPVWLKCALCGKGIAEGENMLIHAKMAHGGNFLTSATPEAKPKSLWITFVQGGLPGLGKRR